MSIDSESASGRRKGTRPVDAEIAAALTRVKENRPFSQSEQLSKFLTYIIDETLAGRSDKIIGYTIGVDVYGRPESFDPSNDAIVRVEAGRLRRSLDQYYREAGADDPIEIVVPKGAYVPEFRYRMSDPVATAQVPPAKSPESAGVTKRGPSIAVLPFRNFGADPADQFFADGLTEETIANLARFKDLFVFSRSTTSKLARDGADVRQLRSELGVDFVVEGSVRKTPKKVRATVQLIDAETDGHILAENFERACTVNGVFEIQDEVARLVAGRVADRHGPLGRYVQRASRLGASRNWDTYGWITRFYNYYATHDPQQHLEVRDGLEDALEKDQQASDGWAALSIVLLDEYRFHLNERHNYPALPKSLECAKRAVSADPENAFAYQALALAHFYSRDATDFKFAADRAIELNPGHADALADIGFCYTHLADWDRALHYSNRAIELSPVHPGWYRFALGAYHFIENDDPQAALFEFKKGAMPGFYWYHAYTAALYALLNEDEKATAEVVSLFECYPDFPRKVREECELLCKPAEWTERLVVGLRLAGLEIDA